MTIVDNSTEFITARLDICCKENKIKLIFIRPEKPTGNACVERFNGSFGRELLNACVFRSISEVKQLQMNIKMTTIQQGHILH